MSFAIPITKRPPNVHMYIFEGFKIYEEKNLPVLLLAPWKSAVSP